MKENRILKFCSIALFILALIPLGACGKARDTFGIENDAPDEFAVIRHAPLEIPENLVLPPPSPGQARPQEITATRQAKDAIFGQNVKNDAPLQNASGAENALLQKSGSGAHDPDIRAKLDAESEVIAEKNKPVVKKLLGLGGVKTEDTSETLNPKTESERLRNLNLPTPSAPPEPSRNIEKK